MIDLLEPDLVRTGDGGELIAAGQRVAGLHPVADALAGDLDGGDEAVVAQRSHFRDAAALGGAFGFEIGGLGELALQLDEQAHGVALGHRLVAGIGLDDDHLGGGHAVEIGTGHQRAQEQVAEAEPAEQHQDHHPEADDGRHIDVSSD